MKRLAILIPFILALAYFSQGGTSSLSHSQEEGVEASIRPCKNRDRLHHESIMEKPSPVAIFTNGQNTYRFSNTRPQRIIPATASKKSERSVKLPFSFLHKQFQKCPHSKRYARLTISFIPFVSCKNIFLALRHIIR